MRENKRLSLSHFNEEEKSIMSDYLDTKQGQADNTLNSYIKINIKNLILFINKKTKIYKDSICTNEAVETLLESLNVFKKENYKFLVL